MALRYTLLPLRRRPDLIPACARILKAEWGHCRTELLPRLVRQELGHAPCSFGLLEHRPDAPHEDTLVGHIRIVPVTDDPTAVYSESLCIDKARRSKGLGRLLMSELEKYLLDLGYQYATYAAFQPWLKSDIQRLPMPTLGANLLRTTIPGLVPGNAPCPGMGGGIPASCRS